MLYGCHLLLYFLFYFFFSSRRRHTRLQGDWSSDVCSSDLVFALRGVSSLPGVSGAALTSNFPASSVDNEKTLFTIQGRSALQASEAPAADLQIISGDYFSVLKIPLVAGRSFTEADTAERTARRPHKPDNGGPLLAQER